MFSRWTQENFFKYLRQECDLDRITHYIVNNIDSEFKVVNPKHSKLTNKMKKIREKISRRRAKLFEFIERNIKGHPDSTEANFKNQSKIEEDLQELILEEEKLLKERKKQPYKIKIKEMEEEIRYNKLDFESKLFQNIIKMICYRAETSFSILLSSNYRKKMTEMRALSKSLIKTKANIIPNETDKTLTIELYSLSNNRDNVAAKEICKILNASVTIFPGTNMRLLYKLATE
jgi:Skp family chaperone for outer membrane proteins